jgi:hypothetical protein
MAADDSPCTRVCVMDGSGHCSGCRRTLDEITCWAVYSPAQKLAVLAQLKSRRAAMNSPTC